MKIIAKFMLCTIIIAACGQDATKQKELELKEREIALKEKELALKLNDSNSNTTIKKSIDTITRVASLEPKEKLILPFIGKKSFFYDAIASTYEITIKQNGDCIITDECRGCPISTIYKGIYKPIIKTKNGGLIKIEQKQVSFLDKNGKTDTGCSGDTEDNSPCIFPLSEN